MVAGLLGNFHSSQNCRRGSSRAYFLYNTPEDTPSENRTRVWYSTKIQNCAIKTVLLLRKSRTSCNPFFDTIHYNSCVIYHNCCTPTVRSGLQANFDLSHRQYFLKNECFNEVSGHLYFRGMLMKKPLKFKRFR